MSNPQTEVKGSIEKKEHFQGFSFSFFEKIEAGERGGKKNKDDKGRVAWVIETNSSSRI